MQRKVFQMINSLQYPSRTDSFHPIQATATRDETIMKVLNQTRRTAFNYAAAYELDL